jgi:hypothetical protein
MPSKRIENPGRFVKALMASKLKHRLSPLTYSSKGSIMMTVEVGVKEKVDPTGASRSIGSEPSTDLNALRARLLSYSYVDAIRASSVYRVVS